MSKLTWVILIVIAVVLAFGVGPLVEEIDEEALKMFFVEQEDTFKFLLDKIIWAIAIGLVFITTSWGWHERNVPSYFLVMTAVLALTVFKAGIGGTVYGMHPYDYFSRDQAIEIVVEAAIVLYVGMLIKAYPHTNGEPAPRKWGWWSWRKKSA